MNKFVCTTVLAAGLAFLGTGEEAHAGNSSFFLSVGGPRASISYGSAFRGGGYGYGGGRGGGRGGYYGGGRAYGWDAGYGRRAPVNYGRVLRPSYGNDYRSRRPSCDRGGYYGY